MSDHHHSNESQDPEDRDARAVDELVDAMLADRAPANDRGDPALRSQAEREFRIAEALREDGPAPSLALLSAVERQVREARAPAGARRARRSCGIRPAFLAVAAGLAAAVALVAVLTIGSSCIEQRTEPEPRCGARVPSLRRTGPRRPIADAARGLLPRRDVPQLRAPVRL